MSRIFTSLVSRAESSARRNRTDRRPRRAHLGLETLEDRRVPTALLASAAFAVHLPPGPIMPTLSAHYPPEPVMPTLSAHYPPNPVMPTLSAHYPPDPV